MAVNSFGTIFRFMPEGGQMTVVGSLVSIGEITCDSEEIDVTTLDSVGGYREYMQGYRDAGSIAVEGYHVKNDAGQEVLRVAYETGKVGGAAVEFPDGSSVKFNAYVKSYTLGAAKVDGAVGFGAVLRITGDVMYDEG